MTNRPLRGSLILAAAIVALAGAAPRPALANACVWNGSATSDWGSLFNWSSCGSTIPQPGDTVTIPNVANQPTMFNPSTASLSMLTIDAGATLTVQSTNGLTLTGGMTGAGNLIVTSNGSLVWTGGTMDGTGTTTVAGHLTLSGASAKTLSRDFTSTSSTGVLSGAGSLTISPGTTFHNAGTLDIQGDGGITGGGVLENTSLLMRTTSGSGTTISCNLASSGAVVVTGTGGLSLSGNGVGPYTGVFNATGSYLGITGGTHTFENSVTADHLTIQASTVVFDAPTSALSTFFVAGGGPPVQVQSSFSSPGNTNLMGGALTATPSSSVPFLGNLSVQGGSTLTLNGSAPVAVTSLFQQGDLAGSENIVISGNFTWSGGMHSGPGTTTVNGTTSLSGGALALSRGLTLNGPSTFGSTSLALSPGLVIHNAGNLSIPPSFTDLTGANVSLENSGSVMINGGAPLSLACSVSNTGTFNDSNRGVTVPSFTQTAGTSTVFFGSLAVTAPPIRILGGTVTGHGTIASDIVVSGGASVAPGLSPGSFGTLVFGGNYTQSAPAAYTADAGSSGSMFTDLLSVPFAAAVIGGPLNLTVGFTPASGDTVPLLSYGSRFGAFGPLGLPPLASGLAWAPRYSATGFSLRVQGLVSDTPILVDAHPASAGVHNGNGVLDPGERVLVEPRWDNFSNGAIAVTGAFSNLTGPSGATYTIAKPSADYGTISANQTADCFSATGSCYEISIDNPATRPAAHWDVNVDETASNGDLASWTFHVGGSFNDVPQTAGQYRFVETLFHNLITGGCGGGGFCPSTSVTRAQMAVFLLKAKFGPSYIPPPATGTVFTDVPLGGFAPFIEQLAALSVTTGCGAGIYCPGSPATRAQMAVFLLKTQGGPAYDPPACVTPTFTDVPCSNPFAKWVEELVARGITAGCGGGLFCASSPVTRGQMAVFLTVTFGLGLNGV